MGCQYRSRGYFRYKENLRIPDRLSYSHHYPKRRIKKNDDLTSLVKECNNKIKNLRNEYNIERFWLGKGPPKVRFNKKYKKLGMKDIRELCRVSDEDFAYKIEKILIDQNKQFIYNPIRGGGGGKASSGPYIIYISF